MRIKLSSVFFDRHTPIGAPGDFQKIPSPALLNINSGKAGCLIFFDSGLRNCEEEPAEK
jgi:hypothetical protein